MTMPRPHIGDHVTAANFVPAGARTRLSGGPQEDVWFIKFDGEEYGPYQSEREAMLFASMPPTSSASRARRPRSCRWTRTAKLGRCGPTGSTLIRHGYKAHFGFRHRHKLSRLSWLRRGSHDLGRAPL